VNLVRERIGADAQVVGGEIVLRASSWSRLSRRRSGCCRRRDADLLAAGAFEDGLGHQLARGLELARQAQHVVLVVVGRSE
jgi:hypothetical protein